MYYSCTTNCKKMGRLILIEEDELRRIFREVLDEKDSSVGKHSENDYNNDDDLATSLYDIAKLFHCSLPKAQHIKNSIPKDQYFQHGRKFAISKSILLKSHNNNEKSK